jgi:hypothetical protein
MFRKQKEDKRGYIRDGYTDIKDSYDHWKLLMFNPAYARSTRAFYASLGWWHHNEQFLR